MYWLLLILRELRRLFSNKTFKMGFTIAILFFAVTSFMAWLPSSKADASTRIDVVMQTASGWLGNDGTGPMASDNYTAGSSGYDGMEDTFFNYYSAYNKFYFSSVSIPTQNPNYDLINLYYFPVSADKVYHIGNGYTGQGLVLLFYSDQAPAEGVGATYLANIDNPGNYDIVSPGYGYFTIAILNYYNNVVANPFIAYYYFDEEVTSTDIETSTNTTTNTIVTESQETRNTITDSNVDNTIVDLLPEDTFENPYEGNVDSIFTKIYNAFTSYQYQTITANIPFTNKSIFFNLNNILGGTSGQGFLPQALRTLISTFWYYVFGRFIIIDILNIIEKIKNGRIDNIVESNVKEDML